MLSTSSPVLRKVASSQELKTVIAPFVRKAGLFESTGVSRFDGAVGSKRSQRQTRSQVNVSSGAASIEISVAQLLMQFFINGIGVCFLAAPAGSSKSSIPQRPRSRSLVEQRAFVQFV